MRNSYRNPQKSLVNNFLMKILKSTVTKKSNCVFLLLKKTFKSSRFCNISNFYNGFFWNRPRFKGHVLNELRVSFNIYFANSTRVIFRNPFLYIFFENEKWICILTHSGCYIPNSGTNERCRISTIIYRSDIVSFYQKFMSEFIRFVFNLKNMLHYFRCYTNCYFKYLSDWFP